jgi:hypothetical protein
MFPRKLCLSIIGLFFYMYTCQSQTPVMMHFERTGTRKTTLNNTLSNLKREFIKGDSSKAVDSFKSNTIIAHYFMENLSLNTKGLSRLQVNQYITDPTVILKALRAKHAGTKDDSTAKALVEQMDSIKIGITQDFLSTYQKIHPFTIWHLGRYNLDTLNKYIYNENVFDALQNVSIQQFTDPNTLINSEIAAVLWGPVRMGVSGSFKSSGDTSKDNAIKTSLQKIVGNGGAINFNLTLPLLFCRDRTDQVHFVVFAQMNNGINPNINDSTGATSFSNNILYSNQTGIDVHFDAGSNDQSANFSLDFPFYYSWGSKNLYAQLPVADYALLKMQLTLAINSVINLHLSTPLWSSSKTVQKIPCSISVQFSPSQAVKNASQKHASQKTIQDATAGNS